MEYSILDLMMWCYVPQAAALGVEEIHTLVLGNEPDVTGPDPRSKVKDVNFIALPWSSQLYIYLFLVVQWIDLRYRGLF